MNKQLIVPVLLVFLLAPINSMRAHCPGCAAGISAAGAAGITLGVAGGIALIAGLVHHHHNKERERGERPKKTHRHRHTQKAQKQTQQNIQKEAAQTA
jgi:hypothetical protein